MFKLVVLSALVAVAVAAPGLLHGGYAHYAAPAIAYPAATSYQSRTDVVSKPVIAAYAAPAVAHYAAPAVAHYAAPAVAAYAAPAVAAYAAPAVAYPSAVSHQSRTDVISKPVVAAYAAPALAYHAAPVAYSAAHYGYGHGYGHGYY